MKQVQYAYKEIKTNFDCVLTEYVYHSCILLVTLSVALIATDVVPRELELQWDVSFVDDKYGSLLRCCNLDGTTCGSNDFS